jgi:AraC-like DNA-binding protein
MRGGVERLLRRISEDPRALYRELAPASDLRELVACTWFKIVGHDGPAALVPIVPDGCTDILTYDDGAPFVVGPDAVTRWTELPEGVLVTGLRLRPGALPAVVGQRADALLGDHAWLADLDRGATRLRHALDGADAVQERLAALEDFVRTRVARVSMRERSLVAACRAVANDSRLSVDRVADGLGWSVRTLHREVVASCGYGPKYLQRVMRVQRALRAMQAAGARPRLADVALACGFADQSHMSRDVRVVTGFTPTAYLTRADPELGRWLDAEETDSF